MTAALVAACTGFVVWDESWGGLRVTVVNRTPERYAFDVTYYGARAKVDLAPGETRAMRLRAVDPPPREAENRTCGILFPKVMNAKRMNGIAIAQPQPWRWGVVEIRPISPGGQGEDRECEVATGSRVDATRFVRRLMALQNPLTSDAIATMTFRATRPKSAPRP